MALVYYLHLEQGRTARLEDSVMSSFSERHYVGSIQHRLVEDGRPVDTIVANLDGDVIVALEGGLPSASELRVAESVLASGKRAYFHWPHEGVVEVLTHERAVSFRLHRRFVSLYWRWRSLRQGIHQRRRDRLIRKAAVTDSSDIWAPVPTMAASPALPPGLPPAQRFTFISESGGDLISQGKGMYVRLDYWAKSIGGGSYGHTCYQSKALSSATVEGIIAVTANDYSLLRDIGLQQIVLPSRTNNASSASLIENGQAYGPAVEGLLALYKPSYVFERLVLGNASVYRACRKLGIPYIAEFNGSEIVMAKEFAGQDVERREELESIEREALLGADIVSVVSEPIKADLVQMGVPESKILVNPNGVDLEAYKPLSGESRKALRASLGFADDDIVLGFCGTFGGWHGVEVLAAAIPKIAEARERAKFLLIGGGNFKHLVSEEIDKHGLSSRVTDVGMVPQMEAARLLAACDIFLSPHSRNMGTKPFFGSPTKLFEYMAFGAGIVCSDLVQLGEVMRPAITLAERNGERRSDARAVLVQPGSVEELVEAAVWLVDEPELRRMLGQNALDAARNYYSWDVHVQALWSFAIGREPGGYNIDRRQV